MLNRLRLGGMMLASLLVVSSCQNEELVENSNSLGQQFTLVASKSVDSRTALNGNQTVWSEGDKIYVSSEDGRVTGVLTLDSKDAGSDTGTFTGFVSGNPANLTYSVYPAPTNGTTLDLSTVYGGKQLNAPMIGKINQDAEVDVQFNHTCGVLYVNLEGASSFTVSATNTTDNGTTETAISLAATANIGANSIAWKDTDNDGEKEPYLNYVSAGNTITVSQATGGVMYLPFFISDTEGLKNVTFKANGILLNDTPIDLSEGIIGKVVKKDIKTLTYVSDATAAALQDAINSAEDGETVTLLNNIEVTADEIITVATGKTVILDLNGKTISSGYQEGSTDKHVYPIDNSGNLTIEGGVIEGRGIYNQDGGTLTINNATVNAVDYNGGACVWSYGGKVYLNNATMTGSTGVVYSDGYLEINGGTYTCYSGIKEDGTQITYPTYNIRANNGLKITDGTFTSRHGVISVAGGECVIEKGSYTIQFASATTSNVVYAYATADLTINGGSFLSDNSANIADSGAAVVVDSEDASVTIYGGTFVGMSGMLSGNAVAYGGTYNTVWNYNHYDDLKDKLAEGYSATQNTDGSWTVSATSVTDAEGLKEALENGESVILTENVETELTTNENLVYGNQMGVYQSGGTFDGNGKELSVNSDSGYTLVTSGGTIKNLTVVDGERGIVLYYPTKDVVIDYVVIDGPGYAINTTEGDGTKNLIVSNSTINGWTSFGCIASASFTNCSLGMNTTKFWQNNGYDADYDRLVRPYVTATFTGCTFEKDYCLSLDVLGTDGEGNIVDEDATITLTNCLCGETVITADNYEQFITVEKGNYGHLVINDVTIW